MQEQIIKLCQSVIFSIDHPSGRVQLDNALRQLRVAINQYLGDVPHYVLHVDDMTQKTESEVRNG